MSEDIKRPGMNITVPEVVNYTIEDVIGMFPNKANTITEEVVDMINQSNNDENFSTDEFMNNMITYRKIMEAKQGSIKEYINAIRFCAYLEYYNDNFTQAYIKARPWDEFVRSRMNLPSNDPAYQALSVAASRYRKNPMVIAILTQADAPLRLMFQGARYQAVAVLVNEMQTATYSKDRITAADKLLTHLASPAEQKVEIDIGIKKDSLIDKYEATINTLVTKQLSDIAQGGDLKAIANIAIISSSKDENTIDAEYN